MGKKLIFHEKINGKTKKIDRNNLYLMGPIHGPK